MRVLNLIDINPVIFSYLPRLEHLAPTGVVRTGLEPVYVELARRYLLELANRWYPGATEQKYCLVDDSSPYWREPIVAGLIQQNPHMFIGKRGSTKYLSGYKGQRAPKPSAFVTARLCLSQLQPVSLYSYEADDILAGIVKREWANFDKICIWTIDSDIYQLVDEKVSCWLTQPYNPQYREVDLKTLDRWFNMRFMKRRKATKKRPAGWDVVQKDIAAHWVPNDAHSSICAVKKKLGDDSDNYPAGMPPEIYDLHLSPIHREEDYYTLTDVDPENHRKIMESLQVPIRDHGMTLIRPWEWKYLPTGDPEQEERELEVLEATGNISF